MSHELQYQAPPLPRCVSAPQSALSGGLADAAYPLRMGRMATPRGYHLYLLPIFMD